MTPAEARAEAAAAEANELSAADQLRKILDLVADSLERKDLTVKDTLDLGKLALDLHGRFRDRVQDARKFQIQAKHEAERAQQ